jgi:hypothetical protein
MYDLALKMLFGDRGKYLGITTKPQGHILVDSELGRGTTFHLFLRASDEKITWLPNQK